MNTEMVFKSPNGTLKRSSTGNQLVFYAEDGEVCEKTLSLQILTINQKRVGRNFAFLNYVAVMRRVTRVDLENAEKIVISHYDRREYSLAIAC